MWTYYQVADEGYVRIDHDMQTAQEFLTPELVWADMDAWYGEIEFNGQGVHIAERDALAAVKRLSHKTTAA